MYKKLIHRKTMCQVLVLVFIQKYDESADSIENVTENDHLALVKNAFIHVLPR